jgi:dihydroorotate dehydrogenase (fumarate)
MDLTTRYLGLTLPHPLILGASPLVTDLSAIRRAEDSGAAAVVMQSLFEEQIAHAGPTGPREESFADALYYGSHRSELTLGPDEYLEQIRRLKDAVRLPIVASLNGTSNGAWLDYARLVDQAGADAIELNAYRVATDPEETAEDVERTIVNMLRSVKEKTSLPVAVKLSPYHTALANFARRLEAAHADGLVLFNRFYQPDIDLDVREVTHRLELSSSPELLLRLRWLAVLSPQVRLTLGVSGGVHSVTDVIKALMTGAHGVQIVSAILKYGTAHFAQLLVELSAWLEAHGYHSLDQLRGSMNVASCPDPGVYERVNYLRVLGSYRPPPAPGR